MEYKAVNLKYYAHARISALIFWNISTTWRNIMLRSSIVAVSSTYHINGDMPPMCRSSYEGFVILDRFNQT